MSGEREKSRAWDRETDGFDKDAHVQEILNLIHRGELTTERQLQLSQKWGCQKGTVARMVSDAFRIIRLSRPSLEDDINRKLLSIEEDRRIAANKVKFFAHQGRVIDERPDPDVGAMIAADRLYLETIGALIRTKQVSLADNPEETQDVQTMLRLEIKNSPQLIKSVLAMMGQSELKQLLDKALTPEVTAGAKPASEAQAQAAEQVAAYTSAVRALKALKA
jgi:hypothetical protein